MRNEGRINLSFNLDDVRQKLAYEYLLSLGRKKSVTVVDLVLSTVNKQQEGEKKQNESESGLSGHLEQLVMESAAENRDYLIQILDKLCFIVSAGQGDKENRKSEYLATHCCNRWTEQEHYTHQRSCSFSTETKDDSCGSGNREKSNTG